MTRKQQTKGNCIYCKRKMTKAGISKHLLTCEKRKETILNSSAKPGTEEIFYHLLIQEAYDGDFWLHLEMSGGAKLEDLDEYLRAIWLECCGHLSQFCYRRWSGEEIPMNIKAKQIFKQGQELYHIYDFGTSSETKIKVVSTRKGKVTKAHPISLMSRNDPPEVYCNDCGEPASWLCIECLYEYQEEGNLCDKHVKVHPHEEYGEPIPIVNSPRVGMCGYTGPAEPPY